MNEALQASARLASLLVDEAHDALIALSADGERRVLLWNPSATALFGRKASEALGARITELHILGESSAGLLQCIDCCDAVGSDTTHTLRRADGVPITCAVRSRLVEANGERAIALSFGAVRERLLAESSDVSDSYYRDLLEAAPDAMVVVTPEGNIQLINAQFERLLGYSRRELLGESIEKAMPEPYRAGHPEHRTRHFSDPHAQAMGHGVILHARRKDGSEFPAELSLAPVQCAGASLVMVTIRDVSARVSTEQALREAKDAAEAAELAKTRLLADMSDEIRTPLTALLGFADLLLDPRLGEKERLDYALTIRRNGEHVLSVLTLPIEGVKDSTTLLGPSEATADTDARQSHEAHEAQRSQGRSLAEDRLVSLYADDPDIGDLVATFAAGLPAIVRSLREALSRCDRAEVIRLAHQLKGAAGGYGFPSITAAAARIEDFARTDGELSEDILTELAELCARTQPGDEAPAAAASPASLPVVLAIDDSSHIQALLAARLSSEQVTLRRAMSAREGLQLAFSNPPDLILLDLDLPDTTGFVVCRELKADSRTSNIPVLFLTGSEDSALKAAAFDLGAVDYITKPFEPTELKARVRAALRTKRYQDLLATRSQLDALTGLWNRGYFDKRLDDELKAASRHAHPLCVALLDIDHFKRVNDTYGHPFGDQVLQMFASVMLKALRSSDVACRYGGEEFALILRETAPEQGIAVAERLRVAIAREVLSARGEEVRVTVSIGLAYLQGQPGLRLDHQAPALIQAADAALYQAKRAGRDRVLRGELR